MSLESIRKLASGMPALEQVHDSVIATDLEGIIASWNAGAQRLHGYTAEEALGRPISFLYAPGEYSRLLARRRRMVLARGFGDLDATIITRSGQRRTMHARLSLIRDCAGTPVGILSFAIDTTELEHVRAELRDRERQLRMILDAIPLYIAHVGRDEKLRFVNRAYEDLIGKPAAQIQGCALEELFGPTYAELRPHMHDALAGKPSETTHEFAQPNGDRRLIHVQRVPDRCHDGRVTGYFTVGTDVTDRIRLEAARLDQEHRLREALVAEVHHRVQNNLQGVVGLLRSEVARRPDTSELLQPAITKVLAVSVGFGLMSASSARELNLCDMTREIARHLAEVTGALIETDLDESIRRKPIKVEARHAVNVALVLNELLSNAIKHAARGVNPVSVSVHVDRTQLSGALVRIFSPGARLPANFNFDSATGLRTGLSLVRILLPEKIAKVTFQDSPEGVSVELRLTGSAANPS